MVVGGRGGGGGGGGSCGAGDAVFVPSSGLHVSQGKRLDLPQIEPVAPSISPASAPLSSSPRAAPQRALANHETVSSRTGASAPSVHCTMKHLAARSHRITNCPAPSAAPSSRQVRVSTLLLWLGVPCLPVMWLLNVGMFYSVYKSPACPPPVRRNVRVSFAGALLWLLLALSWAVYVKALPSLHLCNTLAATSACMRSSCSAGRLAPCGRICGGARFEQGLCKCGHVPWT